MSEKNSYTHNLILQLLVRSLEAQKKIEVCKKTLSSDLFFEIYDIFKGIDTERKFYITRLDFERFGRKIVPDLRSQSCEYVLQIISGGNLKCDFDRFAKGILPSDYSRPYKNIYYLNKQSINHKPALSTEIKIDFMNVIKAIHDEHYKIDQIVQQIIQKGYSGRDIYDFLCPDCTVGSIKPNDLKWLISQYFHHVNDHDTELLMSIFGAHKELTLKHLVNFFSRNFDGFDQVGPIERDTFQDIHVNKEYQAFLEKGSGYINRKPGSKIVQKSQSSLEGFRHLNGESPGHAPPLRSSSPGGSSYGDDQVRIETRTADNWPEVRTRPISSMVHLNKPSVKKNERMDTYPVKPDYISSRYVKTDGLLKEGYALSRPLKINTNRFELFNSQPEFTAIDNNLVCTDAVQGQKGEVRSSRYQTNTTDKSQNVSSKYE